MKPSDIMQAILKITELGSHANTIFDVWNSMLGKEPPTNAPAHVKGLYGIFGKADERLFEVLLEKLEQSKPGSRMVLVGFLTWHFKTATVHDRAISWWYGNSFRSFITGMGSSEGHVQGNEVTTVTNKDDITKKVTKVVTTRELRGAGTNNALNFLKLIVEIIESVKPRELGYQKLLAYFKASGIPHIPDDVDFREFTTSVENAYRNLNAGLIRQTDKVEHRVQRKEQELGWFAHFLRNLF